MSSVVCFLSALLAGSAAADWRPWNGETAGFSAGLCATPDCGGSYSKAYSVEACTNIGYSLQGGAVQEPAALPWPLGQGPQPALNYCSNPGELSEELCPNILKFADVWQPSVDGRTFSGVGDQKLIQGFGHAFTAVADNLPCGHCAAVRAKRQLTDGGYNYMIIMRVDVTDDISPEVDEVTAEFGAGVVQYPEADRIPYEYKIVSCETGADVGADDGPTPAPAPAPAPSPTPAPTSAPSAPTPAPSSSTVAMWGQCGGTNYDGPTRCVAGCTCEVVSEFWSQCSPASSSSVSVASAERSGANQKACTEEGKDPHGAGQKLQCCAGLRSCLGDWSGHGKWYYLCKSSCDSRGSFLSLKQSAKAASKITIVSYNLYWWNVQQNNRFGDIHSRISGEQPFDLIGFQECEDAQSIVQGAGMTGFDYYMGPNKPSANPAPLAWSTSVFEKVSGPGHVKVAQDQYGDRIMTWVRLRHQATGVMVFFANTHGPLGNCGSELGANWVSAVNDNKEQGDLAFMTGDFNCGSGSAAMNRIQGAFADGVDVGIDHILSDVAPDAGSGSRNGSPSDHPLVKGSFTLSSGQATTAPPTSTSRGNDESCTEEGKDPYASGQNVQCCTGLQSCLGAWSGQGSWHYLCKGSCESRGSFLGRKRSTVKAHGHLQLQQ